MKALPNADFRTNLVSLLTQLDEQESKRDRNIYRIGHYLRAADDVIDDIANGMTPAEAFADAFTPTRGMHKIARLLNLPLDVDRGRWITRN